MLLGEFVGFLTRSSTMLFGITNTSLGSGVGMGVMLANVVNCRLLLPDLPGCFGTQQGMYAPEWSDLCLETCYHLAVIGSLISLAN